MLTWPDISFPPINLWSAPKMAINFDNCKMGAKARTKQSETYVKTRKGWQKDGKGAPHKTPVGDVVVIETPLCSYPNCNCPLSVPAKYVCLKSYPIRKANKS